MEVTQVGWFRRPHLGCRTTFDAGGNGSMHVGEKRLGLRPVDDETGRRLRDRRVRMGLSVRQLAEEARVDRARLAALEAGDPNVRATTIAKVDATLGRLEQEMGMDEPATDGDTVEFRVSGNFGVDVVVKGPVRDLPALEEAVNRILSRMQQQSRELPPSP
jgi:transcriptional regulator with XRE-family HTH domain